jgi:hypothetical protein
MLKLPDTSRYLFPIDLPMKEERVARLFKHCGLELTENTKEFVDTWTPHNATLEIMNFDDESKKQFQLLKGWIAAYKPIVNNILDKEIGVLRKQKELKERLQAIGYKDLMWF